MTPGSAGTASGLTPTQRYLRTRLIMAAVLFAADSLPFAFFANWPVSLLWFPAWLFLPRDPEPPRPVTTSKRRLFLSIVAAYAVVFAGLVVWYSFSHAVFARVGLALLLWLGYIGVVSQRWKSVMNTAAREFAASP